MEDNQQNFNLCDICKNKAIFLCYECSYNSYFCDSCYKLIHDIKENTNHKKEEIEYFLPINTRCLDHEKIPYDLFCIDDKGNIFYYIIV